MPGVVPIRVFGEVSEEEVALALSMEKQPGGRKRVSTKQMTAHLNDMLRDTSFKPFMVGGVRGGGLDGLTCSCSPQLMT
jgi:hypothetical protein